MYQSAQHSIIFNLTFLKEKQLVPTHIFFQHFFIRTHIIMCIRNHKQIRKCYLLECLKLFYIGIENKERYLWGLFGRQLHHTTGSTRRLSLRHCVSSMFHGSCTPHSLFVQLNNTILILLVYSIILFSHAKT